MRQIVAESVRIVLHGTNDFLQDVMQRCVAGEVSKINANKLIFDDYLIHLKHFTPGLGLRILLEEGV